MDPQTLDDIPPTEREVDADDTLIDAPAVVPGDAGDEVGADDEDDLL